jgi:hypothetical protein
MATSVITHQARTKNEKKGGERAAAARLSPHRPARAAPRTIRPPRHVAPARERRCAHGALERAPERRRHDIIFLPIDLDHAKSSRRATIVVSSPRPKSLKNPQD